MRISKVSPAVKTAGRYNIYVDGKYSFSLDELQLVQNGLHSGLEISEAQLEQLKSESDFGKNYIRAVDLISRRLRSEREIRDYAFRKQWTKSNTERVIERLKTRGYLNDQRFAELFFSSRHQSGRYSLKRIRLDLVKKGISSDIIDDLCRTNGDSAALLKLIKKRINKYDDENKLIAYLARNGFRYDDIKAALDRYHQGDTEWLKLVSTFRALAEWVIYRWVEGMGIDIERTSLNPLHFSWRLNNNLFIVNLNHLLTVNTQSTATLHTQRSRLHDNLDDIKAIWR